MKAFAAKVAFAVAPVFGVCIAIALLRAAHAPFPPRLELDAWAQWVVFSAVVYACTVVCYSVAERLSVGPDKPAHEQG